MSNDDQIDENLIKQSKYARMYFKNPDTNAACAGERLWIQITKVENHIVFGTLLNAPTELTH